MTAEIPAPQIPEQLTELLDTWGRKHQRIAEIDADLAKLEPAMAELQRQMAELSNRHADLGRKRMTAVEDAKFAHGVAAHGCQVAGVPMPEQPPAPPAPQGIAPAQPSAPESPPDGPTGFFQPSGVEMLAALSQPAADATVTDPPPDGGGQPEQPQPQGDFQPGGGQSEAGQPEARRRRGGRRGE